MGGYCPASITSSSPNLPLELAPPVDNTAKQVQFLEDVDRHVAEKKEARKREVIIRMAKREDANEEIKKLAKVQFSGLILRHG